MGFGGFSGKLAAPGSEGESKSVEPQDGYRVRLPCCFFLHVVTWLTSQISSNQKVLCCSTCEDPKVSPSDYSLGGGLSIVESVSRRRARARIPIKKEAGKKQQQPCDVHPNWNSAKVLTTTEVTSTKVLSN